MGWSPDHARLWTDRAVDHLYTIGMGRVRRRSASDTRGWTPCLTTRPCCSDANANNMQRKPSQSGSVPHDAAHFVAPCVAFEWAAAGSGVRHLAPARRSTRLSAHLAMAPSGRGSETPNHAARCVVVLCARCQTYRQHTPPHCQRSAQSPHRQLRWHTAPRVCSVSAAVHVMGHWHRIG